jgi:histidinol phosphatase-like enzyme
MENIEGIVIAFDFDGVIAEYHGYDPKQPILPPVEEVVKAIKILKDKGFKILVYSTRGDKFLKKYCEDFTIPVDYINHRPDKQGENPGKPIAAVYVDDRAVCYKGQNAEDLVNQITEYKSYWELSK